MVFALDQWPEFCTKKHSTVGGTATARSTHKLLSSWSSFDHRQPISTAIPAMAQNPRLLQVSIGDFGSDWRAPSHVAVMAIFSRDGLSDSRDLTKVQY